MQKIFNVSFHRIDSMSEVVDMIYKTQKPLFITTPNNEFMLETLKNKRFENIINKSDLKLIDSIGMFFAFAVNDLNTTRFDMQKSILHKIIYRIYVVYWGLIYLVGLNFFKKNFYYRKYGPRITGTDFVDHISSKYMKNTNIYIIGSTENACKYFADKYQHLNPNITEVYYRTIKEIKNEYDFKNFNKQMEDINDISTKNLVEDLIKDINKKNIDFIYVALSAPQSAYLADYIFSYIPNIKFIIGCGGAIDYLGGDVSRPPKWVRDLGFEFFYRLFSQPFKRTKRVFSAFFVFWWKVVAWKIS